MAWGGYGRNSPDYVEGTRALTPVAPPVKTVEVAAPAKTVVAASSTHAHHCGDCGADVAASARFCSNCGFNLVAARTERARHACSCGTLFGPNDKFCTSCGRKKPEAVEPV